MLNRIIKRLHASKPPAKRRTAAAACVLAAAIMAAAIWNPGIVGASASARLLPIYCVQRDDKCVSLTFDAAWGNEDTQTLIDILGKYGVKATFFVVGAWAEKYPESVSALSEAGHEVMNHSDDHAHFASLSSEQIAKNVNACSDKIEAVTGVRPILFRAPYGEYDDHVVAKLTELGMYTIQWDVDSLDWKEISASEITSRVKERVQPGSIILFHNAALHTPEALPGIIEYLISEGYTILPVSELIYREGYTINHEGRQIRSGA